MSLKRLLPWYSSTAFALLSVAVTSADTLTLRDGRELVGEVTRVDNGYVIKTAQGSIEVDRADVTGWKRSSPPAAVANPAKPKPAAATGLRAPGASGSALTNDKARKTADLLVSQGYDAIVAGDFKAGRDCLVDVIQIEPRNRKGLEGLGYCYLRMDDMARAMSAFEGALAIPEPASKALAVDLAISLLRNRNPVRGAKVVREYMAAQPAVLDEGMLNAFAICLAQASNEARVNRVYQDDIRFFDQYTAKLEATKPGMKRWGIEWLPDAKWQVHNLHNKEVQGNLDAKWKALTQARKEYSDAKVSYESATSMGSRFRKPTQNLAGMEADVGRKRDRADQLQKEYNELSATLDRPTLPKTFAAISVVDGAAIAIASAAPPSTPPVASHPETVSPLPSTALAPPLTPTPVQPPAVAPPIAAAPPAAAEVPPAPPVAIAKRDVFTYATGFAVAPELLLTSAAVVEGATRINVQPTGGDMMEADVVRTDPQSGLALIRLRGGKMSYLGVAAAFSGGAVQCPCFPVPALFDPVAEMIAGSAAPAKENWVIRLARHPRMPGAPILAGNKLVGVEMASRDNDATSLPTVSVQQIRTFLGDTPMPDVTNADPASAVCIVSAVRSK